MGGDSTDRREDESSGGPGRGTDRETEHGVDGGTTDGPLSTAESGDERLADPVRSARSATDADLYDVATWEPRTRLDGVATRVHGALRWSRRPALVTFALVLFVAQLALSGFVLVRQPTLAVLAVLSAVPAVLLVGGIWYADPAMRRPLEPLAVTFLLAVLFASFAAVVNTLLNPVFSLVPVVGTILFFFLVVGPVEETVKWLAVRIHAYDSSAFDAVVDGAVYGAVAGLGFATIENGLYITRQVLEASSTAGLEPLSAAVGTATQRAFVGPGHVIYSAFAGYYLGLAKFNPDARGPIVVKGLLIAAGIHGLYNVTVSFAPFAASPLGYGPTFLLFVLAFDGFFGYVLYRKLSRYRGHYEALDSAAGQPASD